MEFVVNRQLIRDKVFFFFCDSFYKHHFVHYEVTVSFHYSCEKCLQIMIRILSMRMLEFSCGIPAHNFSRSNFLPESCGTTWGQVPPLLTLGAHPWSPRGFVNLSPSVVWRREGFPSSLVSYVQCSRSFSITQWRPSVYNKSLTFVKW